MGDDYSGKLTRQVNDLALLCARLVRRMHAARNGKGSAAGDAQMEMQVIKYLTLGDRCLCCGSGILITQDHIVPLARGGLHHPTNLQPLCRPCNERKQARNRDFRTDEQRAAVNAVWVVEFRRVKP